MCSLGWEALADIVVRYAQIGEMEDSRRLASRLVVMAFGVGYRKDNQFDSLGRMAQSSSRGTRR